MTNVPGQIVEIPITSPHYNDSWKNLFSKKEQLKLRSQTPQYSLFDGILKAGHDGIEHFQVGQRKGIPISGNEKPFYVIAIDQKENRIFVGAGKDHPGLFRSVVELAENDSFNKNNFEHSISNDTPRPVTIVFDENGVEIPANLYHYETEIFLEFAKALKISPHKNPITIIEATQTLLKTFINLSMQ